LSAFPWQKATNPASPNVCRMASMVSTAPRV
jgi:hypothetical protein